MTKICHITTVHSNRYDPRIFERECTSLAEAGYDVTLIVNDDLPNERKNDVKIISLHKIPKNRIDRANRIAKLAYKRAIEINAEIYHIHDPELLRIAVRLSKQGKKVIFDSHEFTAVQILTKPYLPRFARKPMSNIYRKYEEVSLNKLSGLIYPCTYEGKDYFNNVHIPKVLIGNCPSIMALKKAVEGLEEIKKEPKVCYVGGISESRGVFHMVKAAAIAGRKLVLIGDIPKDLREQLDKMPEFINVECLGRLPHDVALREVSKCAVGLSLLQNEGQYAHLDNLPTKLYEYMALGIPVVVSDFPYYRQALCKYEFGISVNAADDEEISKAINRLINDEEYSKYCASQGKKAIHEKFNWSLDAKKLIVFYESLQRGLGDDCNC